MTEEEILQNIKNENDAIRSSDSAYLLDKRIDALIKLLNLLCQFPKYEIEAKDAINI